MTARAARGLRRAPPCHSGERESVGGSAMCRIACDTNVRHITISVFYREGPVFYEPLAAAVVTQDRVVEADANEFTVEAF